MQQGSRKNQHFQKLSLEDVSCRPPTSGVTLQFLKIHISLKIYNQMVCKIGELASEALASHRNSMEFKKCCCETIDTSHPDHVIIHILQWAWTALSPKYFSTAKKKTIKMSAMQIKTVLLTNKHNEWHIV